MAPTPLTEAPIPEPPFDDADVEVLLFGLLQRRNSSRTRAIVDAVAAAGDQRFVAVLVELVRSNEMVIIRGPGVPGVRNALKALTGFNFVYTSEWTKWYAQTNLQAPPGFSQWKGWLLGAIDPVMTEFFQGEDPGKIRTEEIVWGGVRVDGIPPLENPAFRPAADVDYLEPDDLLFGVSINGDHRAYPLRILDWHELANDVVGGVPVSLVYCTLCGAGVLFDGRVDDTVFTFGTSGLLMRSNKLMYDRNTRSLWNQLSGEPVLGPLATSDIRLNILPVVVSTWADWTAQHPDSLALDIETGYLRAYSPGAAYGAYFASPETRFPVPFESNELRTKDRVFGLTINGVRRAYLTELLTERVVVNDELAGQERGDRGVARQSQGRGTRPHLRRAGDLAGGRRGSGLRRGRIGVHRGRRPASAGGPERHRLAGHRGRPARTGRQAAGTPAGPSGLLVRMVQLLPRLRGVSGRAIARYRASHSTWLARRA